MNYDSVNKILLKNKIRAPKLIREKYKNNLIEIEDLGDKTLFKILFVIVIFILAIFLIEKISFPSPKKNYQIDVTNEIKKL